MLKRGTGVLSSLVRSNTSKTDYWRHQSLGGDHGAHRYFNVAQIDVANLWRPVAPWTAGLESALEVGCNSGRNVEWLATQGIRNLVGVDVSADAIALAKTIEMPVGTDVKWLCSDAIPYLKSAPTFDLVLSKGFLINVSGKNVLKLISNRARKIVILKEQEQPWWVSRRRSLESEMRNSGFSLVYKQLCHGSSRIDSPIQDMTCTPSFLFIFART